MDLVLEFVTSVVPWLEAGAGLLILMLAWRRFRVRGTLFGAAGFGLMLAMVAGRSALTPLILDYDKVTGDRIVIGLFALGFVSSIGMVLLVISLRKMIKNVEAIMADKSGGASRMTFFLYLLVAVVYLAVGVAPLIAGAVMARRAWKRNDWPEMRLAYVGFVSIIVITLFGVVAMPLIGLSAGNSSFDVFEYTRAIVVLLSGVVTVLIPFGMYRLAKRVVR